MTGIVGGRQSEGTLDSMTESLYHEQWYTTERLRCSNAGISLVEHGDRDAAANEVWKDDDTIGVIYGVITQGDEAFEDIGALFSAILSNPESVLEGLEGPFVLACHDVERDRTIVATDKSGSRQCFYTDANDFAFGSEVKALVPCLSSPTVDITGVSDMLSFGFVVGEHTLVEEIKTVPPASYVEYTDGDASVHQYWEPSFDHYEKSDYPDSWIDAFSDAVSDVSTSVDDGLSLWLSGGIDSRATATVLDRQNQTFDTLTYKTDSGRNPDLAARVASSLNVDNEYVGGGTTDEFINDLEKSVTVTDGMLHWASFHNLGFTFRGLHGVADVVMEGGTFMGEDVWLHTLEDLTDPTSMIQKKWRRVPEDDVASLLTTPIDQNASLCGVVNRGDVDDPKQQALWGMRQIYAYSHKRSNAVQRSQVGTRTISHGTMLNAALELPDDYRMKTIPMTDGKIPAAVPKIKLKVMRALDGEAAGIPYERTRIPPTMPYIAHIIGFGVTKATELLQSSSVRQHLRLYRTNDRIQEYVDDLVDAAAERPFLDHDAVTELRDEIRTGDHDSIVPLASLTALELWLQRYYDPKEKRRKVVN